MSDDNPAYQMWNELRDLRITKTLGAFDAGESSRLVTQFERSINDKLLPPLRRRLQEQGQGLPWFLKKLCIHVHNQVGRGVSQVDLLGSRLNVEGLFQEDLEPLNESQLSCLHFVALNSPVDSLEVYDKFGTEVVGELVEKRLVVRAGERFAVYWDIFRDYLTDKTVPYIPFTYLPNCTLRMGISVCEVLATRGVTSHADLAHALGYRESTIVNVATDLQNLAVCGKAAGGLQLLDSLSFQKIPDRLNAQLSEHVLYQRLLQGAGDSQNLSRSEGVQLVRELYSGARVKAQTRDNYFLRILVIHFTLVVNQAILGLAPLAAKIGAIERGLSKASGGVH